ncbi:MAG: hypothetical protein JOZ69_20665 [Myxococcales bacterium]|nr:hypothetical protein [Myxococcales bacterium]
MPQVTGATEVDPPGEPELELELELDPGVAPLLLLDEVDALASGPVLDGPPLEEPPHAAARANANAPATDNPAITPARRIGSTSSKLQEGQRTQRTRR